jgi:hypothetical protein
VLRDKWVEDLYYVKVKYVSFEPQSASAFLTAQTPLSVVQVYYSAICCNSYLCSIAQNSSVREVGIFYFTIICCSTCAAFVRIELTATQVFVTFPWFVVQWHSHFKSPESEWECKKKVKEESRNRPVVAQRVPGSLGSQIFMTFDTWRWWGRHTPRKCSWYSF